MSDTVSRDPVGRLDPATEASLSPRDGDSGSARSSLSSSSSPGDSATASGEMKGDYESLVLHLPAKLYASQVAQIREEKPKRSATTPTSTRPTQVPPLVFPLTNNFEERPAMPHIPPANAANGSFFGHNAESNATLGSPQQYWDPNDASYVLLALPPFPITSAFQSLAPFTHPRPPCARSVQAQSVQRVRQKEWALFCQHPGPVLSVFLSARSPCRSSSLKGRSRRRLTPHRKSPSNAAPSSLRECVGNIVASCTLCTRPKRRPSSRKSPTDARPSGFAGLSLLPPRLFPPALLLALSPLKSHSYDVLLAPAVFLRVDDGALALLSSTVFFLRPTDSPRGLLVHCQHPCLASGALPRPFLPRPTLPLALYRSNTS